MLGTTVKFLIQKNWLNFMNPFIWRLRPALHQDLQKMPMLKVVRCLRQNGCDRRCDILSIKPLYMHAFDQHVVLSIILHSFTLTFGILMVIDNPKKTWVTSPRRHFVFTLRSMGIPIERNQVISRRNVMVRGRIEPYELLTEQR